MNKIYFLSFFLFYENIYVFSNGFFKYDIKDVPFDAVNLTDGLDIGLMMYIISIEPYNSLAMEFRVDYLLEQTWYPHPNVCLSLYDSFEVSIERKQQIERPIILYDINDINNVWLPDTHVSNSRDERFSSDTETVQTISLSSVSENECLIQYLSKLNTRVSCNLFFKYYPFDEQRCNMTIRSYALNNDLVDYSWITKESILGNNHSIESELILADGLVLLFPINLNELEMSAETFTYTEHLYFTYSTLYVTFIYKRKIFGHIITIYLPSTILVFVAWMSLWIDINELGRVLNCMTCFLSLLTQFIDIRSQLPIYSFISGSDIWMIACLSYIFLILLQYTVLKYLQNNPSFFLNEKFIKNSRISEHTRLNDFFVEKNKEKLEFIRKIKSINSSFKNKVDLYFLSSKNKFKSPKNQRLDFLLDQSYKSLNSHFNSIKEDEKIYSFNKNEYDLLLQERLEKLVKYNSSSSDTDSDEEDTWLQKIQQNDHVQNFIDIIDYYSRIFFFFLIIIFTIFYWQYMFIVSKNQFIYNPS